MSSPLTSVWRRQGVQPPLGDWRAVAAEDDLGPAGRRVVHIGGTRIVVIRVRRRVFAVVDACPHLGKPLADAKLRGLTLTCMHHGRSYDLSSGRQVGRVLCAAGRLFQVAARVVDGWVYVDVSRFNREDPAPSRGLHSPADSSPPR
jgi:3-phenylpropionate/trans-cinnamate dioxygenase ferredoxin component